ncbi:MAG: VOC family protein [Chloroflexi bacterium]|nr:VOC family protein [Chloroflexota bacterium]
MISDVHHVGIAVRDIQAALAFYRDALRLPVVKEGTVEARGVRASLVRVGGSYLEIVQPARDDSPFAQHIAERGEGLHHLAFRTHDAAGAVARLREAGVALQDLEPREGFTGRLSYLAAEAFDGALLEVVQPESDEAEAVEGSSITRIDHVVVSVPDLNAACDRLAGYFGLEPKRRLERGPRRFAFFRPGDVIVEVIGPADGAGKPGTARIAGIAFEVAGIDAVTDRLRAEGFPVGTPHPALQGGRIVSVHASATCGVPVAFIDFS